jgi:CelD/BcsL family acetyltransferase involved in cellulose biosynthesis
MWFALHGTTSTGRTRELNGGDAMETAKVAALSQEHWARWSELHDALGTDVGPLLHPAYVRAVGTVRQDVEVGVLTHFGEVVGFLPYQRSRLDVATAVGGRLCDQSGAVVRRDAVWSPTEFARAAGLRAIRLKNCHRLDASLEPFQSDPIESSVVDLGEGFDAYARGPGARLMREMGQKSRKAEREIGPVRFEWHTQDPAVFSTLLEWKAAQRRATRSPNVLELKWARDLVEILRIAGGDTFGGVMSALWYGDRLAAAHMSIRSRHVLHYWVIAYEPSLARYSPGTLLLLTVARVGAEEHGVRRIELGVGDQSFKVRARTGTLPVATTTVTSASSVQTAFRMADRLRTWSHASSMGRAARATRRAFALGAYKVRSNLG